MARIVSFTILIAILLAMSALFLWVMADFILPIFLALLLVVMFGPVHRWFVDKFQGRVRLAALATTGTILLSVLIPLTGVLALAANESVKLYEHLKGAQLDVREVAQKAAQLAAEVGWTLDPAEVEQTVISRAQEFLTPLVLATPGYLGRLLLSGAIMILAVYYFFADGPAMIRAIMRLSPLDDKYEQQLIDQFDVITRAVVLATVLAALAQGLAAGVGYFFVGIGSVVLLTVLSVLLAMIPFIGAAGVWVPVCLWLAFIHDRPVAAILLTVYCLAVVSTIDNLIRPYILQGRSSLHPLLALLSVIGGAQALGPIGIFVGPMVVVFLQALLNMLHSELGEMDRA
ncbi:MAG: AI-2E family transporter [Thermoguttaceae bacterium]|jgi:predicted PurR-regulated permease PerM|nr:AI-2E family transporter [Thermoguttaceae bacterium]